MQKRLQIDNKVSRYSATMKWDILRLATVCKQFPTVVISSDDCRILSTNDDAAEDINPFS